MPVFIVELQAQLIEFPLKCEEGNKGINAGILDFHIKLIGVELSPCIVWAKKSPRVKRRKYKCKGS